MAEAIPVYSSLRTALVSLGNGGALSQGRISSIWIDGRIPSMETY